VRLSTTLIVLQPGTCHFAITKPLTSQSALAAAIDPQNRGETSQYPFMKLKPAVDGFPASGCDEPESCFRFKLAQLPLVCLHGNVYRQWHPYIYGLDLNQMFEFGHHDGYPGSQSV
jgi:hypothetical protein